MAGSEGENTHDRHLRVQSSATAISICSIEYIHMYVEYVYIVHVGIIHM
jgi:hypothetical protein